MGILSEFPGEQGTVMAAARLAESAAAQAKARPSLPISAADVARMLQEMGVDRVISVDLQPPGQGQLEGFFSDTIPVENLRSTAIGVEHAAKLRLQRPVVVAPNERCLQWANDYQSALEKRLGVPVGIAALLESGSRPRSTKNSSADLHNGGNGGNKGELHRMELVGEVAGRDVLIVDDMIDTGASLAKRSQLLKEMGARRIVVIATHALLNGNALARITRSPISDVVVTNTLPLRNDVDTSHTHKIAQVSVAPLIAEAILRMQTGQSLQRLRTDAQSYDCRYKGQE